MKSCFISRIGGIGDLIHSAHIPQLLKEHHGDLHITFETNYNGFHILTNNPYVDKLEFVDYEKMTNNRYVKHLEYQKETSDLFFNFIDTIEKQYCTNETDQRYYRSTDWRRTNLGAKSYYDVMVDEAGLPSSFYGRRPHLYYSDEEHASAKEWVEKVKERHNTDFVIIINLSGSTLHKKFIQVETVCKEILKKHPQAKIYLTGDECCNSQLFEMDRVRSMIGKWDFRTVALQCKYVDLTISMESGLALVAHSWDAPCLQLLTAASSDNHVKYAKNAYYLQSEVACSPCHRNPREFFGCPTFGDHPSCIYFDIDKIINKVEEAYERSSEVARDSEELHADMSSVQ